MPLIDSLTHTRLRSTEVDDIVSEAAHSDSHGNSIGEECDDGVAARAISNHIRAVETGLLDIIFCFYLSSTDTGSLLTEHMKRSHPAVLIMHELH